LLFLLVAFTIGVGADLFFIEVMAYARVHDCLEDIRVAGGTDFVFIAVLVLEEFPFQTAIVRGVHGFAGDFPVLEIQGTFGLDCAVIPD
jgi:hypothetical protein